jgi:hypothetical protein
MLFFIRKKPQICFQTLVDNFHMTISLGMIRCAEMQLGALEIKQFLPKIACESWVTIRNNRVWHAMNLEDLVHETLSHHGCNKWVLKSIEMRILGKAIHNHHYD